MVGFGRDDSRIQSWWLRVVVLNDVGLQSNCLNDGSL
jgi:hypothetical protein